MTDKIKEKNMTLKIYGEMKTNKPYRETISDSDRIDIWKLLNLDVVAFSMKIKEHDIKMKNSLYIWIQESIKNDCDSAYNILLPKYIYICDIIKNFY